MSAVDQALVEGPVHLLERNRPAQEDPRAPRLRLHPLTGRHRGKHAVSLTYSHRIVLILRLDEDEVILLDAGDHDSVYRR